MPRKATGNQPGDRSGRSRTQRKASRVGDRGEEGGNDSAGREGQSETETTAIVLRIASARSAEFEALFEAEEIPIWDDFTRRHRFLEARLVRVEGGSEVREGIRDYILHIVAADHEAHEEHDRDPRFNAFLGRAQGMQPREPLVWFGQTIFERRA